MDADLLVAGAGPVGLAVGVLAATAGFDVLIADPRFDSAGGEPIDKACGEGLVPVGLRRLQALGVDPPGRPLAGIRYLPAAGGPAADARFRTGAGRGVRRTVLQRALASRATGVGARVLPAAVAGFMTGSAGVRARLRGDGGTAEVRCRWLVGADGLHSSVRRAAGLADA
ncbi:MAG: NAD(P)/FAD-dependent oxidoreductase, partial [Frankiaceae bacterium]